MHLIMTRSVSALSGPTSGLRQRVKPSDLCLHTLRRAPQIEHENSLYARIVPFSHAMVVMEFEQLVIGDYAL